MTAKEAYEDALDYAMKLRANAEKNYPKGERKTGVIAGINMMISGLKGKIEEADQEEAADYGTTSFENLEVRTLDQLSKSEQEEILSGVW